MKTDDLRLYVLSTWIAGVVACGVMFLTVLVNHHAALTPALLAVPALHLTQAVTPTLGALLVSFYSADLKAVRLTRGQRRLLLVLSSVYVIWFTTITYLSLYVDVFGIDKNATDKHPAVNNFSFLITYVQPLIVAPLFYLF